MDDLIKSLQKGDIDQPQTASALSTSTGIRDSDPTLRTFKASASSSASTVASHLLMSEPPNMIPNNQSALLSTNKLSVGGRSGPPPLPDNYKNNILKAKTFDENKIAEVTSGATSVGVNHSSYASEKFHR